MTAYTGWVKAPAYKNIDQILTRLARDIQVQYESQISTSGWWIFKKHFVSFQVKGRQNAVIYFMRTVHSLTVHGIQTSIASEDTIWAKLGKYD